MSALRGLKEFLPHLFARGGGLNMFFVRKDFFQKKYCFEGSI